jgi:glycosyltransferase involved in cell wall biosynthesis
MEVKISIIIPVYNMEKYLTECLDSVFGQTLKEIEVICVNDGSTDSSGSILEDYQKRNSNMIIINEDNSGSGIARNKGLEVARGEYVAFMDPDDYYPNNIVLEKLYGIASEKNLCLCGGTYLRLKENKLIQTSDRYRNGCGTDYEGYIDNSYLGFDEGYVCFLFHTKLLTEYNIRFPYYRRFQDPPFFTEVVARVNKIYVIPDVVYIYRIIDKKINFSNEIILHDCAEGIYKTMCISRQFNLRKIYRDIWNRFIKSYINHFYIAVYKGDDKLYDILKAIYSEYCPELFEDNETIQNYKFSDKKEEIISYVETYKEKLSELTRIISQYHKIIIYGAGEYGKRLYDFIESLGKKIEICFAVSDIKGDDLTARGKQVYSIKDFLPDIKSGLVIVAVGDDRKNEMISNAKNIGFKNVICVDYVISVI